MRFLMIMNIQENPGYYFFDKGITLIIAIIQAIFIFVITNIFLNKVLRKQQMIGISLSEYGIDKVSASKKGLLGNSSKILFGLSGHQKPKEVKLCFITGFGFIQDFQSELEELVKNGTNVKILLGNPENGRFDSVFRTNAALDNVKEHSEEMAQYYTDILFKNKHSMNFLENCFLMLEYNKCINAIKKPFDKSPEYQQQFKEQLKTNMEGYGNRKGYGDHIFQIHFVKHIIDEINNGQEGASGKIHLAHYNDEYRMPMIIAEYDYDNKNKKTRTLLWTNINAPIIEASESINIFCQEDESESKPYINDVVKSFDYLWKKYYKEDLGKEEVIHE